jgi:uncharacterized protein (DUF952 family)
MSRPDTGSPTRPSTILHICPMAEWNEALPIGEYAPDSLAAEGFIHCSTTNQVVGVANSLYTGHKDLVLLIISANQLTASLVYEDCYELGEEFPHVYGPLNAAAVLGVLPFPPDSDGRFSLPSELGSPT